jgi:hypothetical protein
MPAPLAPRTPGYRFKDGKLMIFREDEVMLIQGGKPPSALRKSDEYWEPFIPEFRLVAPYRRASKPPAKKVAEKPLPPAAGEQLDFDLWGVAASEKTTPPKPAIPKPSPLSEQRRRAFDAFRFSLPKEIAKVVEGFRSHQWNLIVLLAHDKKVMDLATTNPVLAYAVADWYGDYTRCSTRAAPHCASGVFPMATGASPNSKRPVTARWTPPPANSSINGWSHTGLGFEEMAWRAVVKTS